LSLGIFASDINFCALQPVLQNNQETVLFSLQTRFQHINQTEGLLFSSNFPKPLNHFCGQIRISHDWCKTKNKIKIVKII